METTVWGLGVLVKRNSHGLVHLSPHLPEILLAFQTKMLPQFGLRAMRTLLNRSSLLLHAGAYQATSKAFLRLAVISAFSRVSLQLVRSFRLILLAHTYPLHLWGLLADTEDCPTVRSPITGAALFRRGRGEADLSPKITSPCSHMS